MKTPLSLIIGLRYTRAKRRSQFISFISLASMLGIAIGVMVLITVLSVMNGFKVEIRQKFFAIAPQVTAMTRHSLATGWEAKASSLLNARGVSGAAPFVRGKGMITRHGQMTGLQVIGIVPGEEGQVSELAQHLEAGKLSNLKAGRYGVILGAKLAKSLHLVMGDKITLMTPRMTTSLLGVFPSIRQMKVVGIFHVSAGFGFEDTTMYTNLQDAERLFPGDQGLRGYHVKLKDLYQAHAVSELLQTHYLPGFYVSNWMEEFGAFFQALNIQKTMLFVILLLIVAVAAFNLVSTLVMVVNDKRADIAILRTLGATPGMIMRSIMVQGALVGLVGTMIGVLTGVLLALNITALTNWVQDVLNMHILNASVFFLDYLPSDLALSDVLLVAGTAFGLSVIATIYPAYQAYRIQPAEALRYE